MYVEGYGALKNNFYVVVLSEKTYEEKIKFLKDLKLRDSKSYDGWKSWCRAAHQLQDLFGTEENPKDIDESNL